MTEADGAGQLIIKGDIAHVVARCGFVEYRDAVLPMDEDKMRSVASVVDEMLQDGMKGDCCCTKEDRKAKSDFAGG